MKGHKGHATRGGFRSSTRSRGAAAPATGADIGDMPMAGGAPSTTGSDNLAPGETSSMPAPMPGPGTPDPGAGSFGEDGGEYGSAPAFRSDGRVRR